MNVIPRLEFELTNYDSAVQSFNHYTTKTSCPQLTPTPTDSSRLCPGYIFVWHPPASAVLPLIYTGASLDWRLGRGSVCYNHPILIFQNSTCGIFFHVRLHPPHTHILQIMLKDHNSKIQKEITWTTAKIQKEIRRRCSHYVTLAQANYYLDLFPTILCAVDYPDMRASKSSVLFRSFHRNISLSFCFFFFPYFALLFVVLDFLPVLLA